MPYDKSKVPDVKEMREKLQKTYANVSDTAVRQAIAVFNSVYESTGDEGRAWASVYSQLNKRGLSKKSWVAEALEKVALRHPEHAEVLRRLAKEAAGWIPGELRENKVWETGTVDETPLTHKEEGSQVPPARTSHGDEITEEGEVVDSIPRVRSKEAFGWTDEEIIDYYDNHPNLTLRELSRMTGRSVQELKRLLMSGRHASVEDSWERLARKVLGSKSPFSQAPLDPKGNTK